MRIICLALMIILLIPVVVVAQEPDTDPDALRAAREEAITEVELGATATMGEGAVTLQIPEDWLWYAQQGVMFIARDEQSFNMLAQAIGMVFENIQQELDPDAEPRPTPEPAEPGTLVAGMVVFQSRAAVGLTDEPTADEMLTALGITDDNLASVLLITELEIDEQPAMLALSSNTDPDSADENPNGWIEREILLVIVYPEHVLFFAGFAIDETDASIILEAVARSITADLDALSDADLSMPGS